ncbi:hypothetical protein NRIC_26600 [Enterococcus florum]|uniref:Prealbumin-like fold domain-containing protein n=1 Tax=Enterococcus florum TaxID=2480627 RepID=A0A4V0WPR4_9ENTE|nr:SpaA isopeptide-forming pilin-related protein [Enterococcus florum]GCF94769.1 hypothetical protein NRIC_26600 [Enterococcus florum]
MKKLGLCLVAALIICQQLTGFATAAATSTSSTSNIEHQITALDITHEDDAVITVENPVQKEETLTANAKIMLNVLEQKGKKKITLPLPKEVEPEAKDFKIGADGIVTVSETEITLTFPSKTILEMEELAVPFRFKLKEDLFKKETVKLTFFDEIDCELAVEKETAPEVAKPIGGVTPLERVLPKKARGIGPQAGTNITELLDIRLENIYYKVSKEGGGTENVYIIENGVKIEPQPEVTTYHEVYYNFTFELDIDKNHVLTAGDHIIFELPDVVDFTTIKNQYLMFNGEVIGTINTGFSGGKSYARIDFNSKINGYMALNDGYLYANGRFNQSGHPVEGGTNQVGSIPIVVGGDSKPGIPGIHEPGDSPVVKYGSANDRTITWDFDLFYDSYYKAFEDGTLPEKKEKVIFEDVLDPGLKFSHMGVPTMFIHAADPAGGMKEDGYLGFLPFESNGVEYFRKLVQGVNETNADFENRIKAETNVPCYGVTDAEKYDAIGNKLIINFGEVPNSTPDDPTKGFVLAGDPLAQVQQMVDIAKAAGKITQAEADKTMDVYSKLFAKQEKGVYGLHFSVITKAMINQSEVSNDASITWENKGEASNSSSVDVFVPDWGGGVSPVNRGTVTLEKKDHETGKALANVEFLVQTKGLVSYYDFETVKTDDEGKITLYGIREGDYRIKEINNPNAGYQNKVTFEPDDGIDDDEWHYFRITPYSEGPDVNQLIELVADNYRSEGSLILTKKNQAETELLNGAKFTLHKASDDSELEAGYEFETGKCYKYVYDKNEKKYLFEEDTGATAEKGKLKITGLPLDTYYLIETQAPPGHMLSDNPDENKIVGDPLDTHNQVLELTMKNNPAVGSIRLFKKDQDKTTPLPDAKFVLYKKDGGGTPQYYKLTGSTITWVTNKADATRLTTDTPDGKITVDNLLEGTYFFQEVEAPPGYQLDETEQEIDLSKNDIIAMTTPSITMENEPSEIEIIKKDSNTGDVLPGASFQLYNDADQVLNEVYKTGGTAKTYTTNNDGKIVLVKLPDGRYYLKETQAPTGYEQSDEKHWFEVKDGKLVGDSQVVIENQRKGHLPSTGSPWAGIMNRIAVVIILIGLAGVGYLQFRRKMGGKSL